MTVPSFTLNDGNKIPAVGYGVGTKWGKFKSKETVSPAVVAAVTTAIDSGFIHIDGAESYGTEQEIGQAIRDSGLPRSKFFITTKVLPNIGNPEKALETSLNNLGLDYIDLYLIHAPFVTVEELGISLEDAWKALESLQKAGKTKSIGVSNFSPADLDRILAIATTKPAVNQIEFSPYLQNQTPGIYKYAQEHGILLTAYSPLGPIIAKTKDENAPLTPVLDALAKKYNRSPAQIVLRWTYQNNVLPITTSEKVERVKEALAIFDFELSAEDLEQITKVGSTYTFRQYWGHKFETKNSSL